MTLGERIRSIREKKRMTQETLAMRASLPLETIQKYENDQIHGICIDELEAIVHALRSSVPVLMGWYNYLEKE